MAEKDIRRPYGSLGGVLSISSEDAKFIGCHGIYF